MSKAVIYVAIGIILLALWAYFILPNIEKNRSAEMIVTPSPTSSPVATASGQSANSVSIQELLAAGEPVRCSFAGEDANGVLYMRNGEIRIDGLQSGQAAQFEQASAIYSGNEAWIWDNRERQGFSFAFATVSVTGEKSKINPTVLADLKEYKYRCKEATVDEALFTPPADITFLHISEGKQ